MRGRTINCKPTCYVRGRLPYFENLYVIKGNIRGSHHDPELHSCSRKTRIEVLPAHDIRMIVSGWFHHIEPNAASFAEEGGIDGGIGRPVRGREGGCDSSGTAMSPPSRSTSGSGLPADRD